MADEPTTDLLDSILQVIDECYERVDSLTELETYVSTEDLFDAIQEIFPGDYSPAIISQGMQQYGFKFTLLPSDRPQFVWLIKRR